MASIDLIRASNGSGDAVKATVANARVISSTTLQVDATTNWPSKFIATVGDVDGTGAFVPATVTVFNGILSGGNIEITSFAPGYTDLGNVSGQIVVLKPTTAWSNEVASTLGVAHSDDGTLKANSVTTTAVTDANVTISKLNGGSTAGVLTTDASGVVSILGNYSTSEASTNTTWVDGKTIYKRTFTGTITIAANTMSDITLIASGIDKVISGEGWWAGDARKILVGTTWFGAGMVSYAGSHISVDSSNALKFRSQINASRTSEPYEVTVFYTKV